MKELRLPPNQLLELTAYPSLCLQYGAYGPYLAALGQTRAGLNGPQLNTVLGVIEYSI